MWDKDFLLRVKEYLRLTAGILDADDQLLEQFIDSSEAQLEAWTGRLFSAQKQTRAYDYPDDDPYSLFLDGDLQKVIKLGNGDGTLIPASDFAYIPANRGIGNDRQPAFEIVLINGARFTYTTTPIQCIKLRGWWGWSMAPNDYTQQAVKRLTAFFYKQKDAQVFDTTAFLDGGVLVIPQGIPKYVADFISFHRPLR